MLFTDPYLLGPLGAMDALPAPPATDGLDADYVRGAAVHESVLGTATLDLLSVKREWRFKWPLLKAAAAPIVPRLAARWAGLHTSPLRLLDPLEPNLLSMDAASSGGLQRSPAGVSVSGGTVVVKAVADGPLVGVCDYVLEWTVPSSGGRLLFDDTALLRSPTLGLAMASAAWARITSGAGVARGILRPYTAAGAAGTDVLGGQYTLDAAGQTLPNTGTPAGVSVASGVVVTSGTGTRVVQVAAPRLAHGAVAPDWTPGAGCPRVLLTAFSRGYRQLGRPAVELTLREA